MAQTYSQLAPRFGSQCDRILEELVQHHGEWVPMPRLSEISSSLNVHSRIADLRKRGHIIEVRVEGQRPRKSSYRLVSPIQKALL